MPESTPVNPAASGLEVCTYFVRGRNVLLAQADCSELFVDFYLHLSDQKMKPEPEHAAMFKRALAAFTLHCASQPRNVLTAWTMNFQQPLVNIFLAGDNEIGAVTGRVFEDNVKRMPTNMFFADVVRGRAEPRRSSVDFTGADPMLAVEKFYAQSEQRTARFFETGEERFAMVTEHPDCDRAWLHALTTEAVKTLAETETLTLLEKRVARWHCGCNQERILQVLLPAMREDPAALFGQEARIEIRCPRCAARHVVTREALEAYAAEHP